MRQLAAFVIASFLLGACIQTQTDEAAQASAKRSAATGAKTTAAPAEKNVRPGINKSFLDPDFKVSGAVQKFERESREIFVQRVRITNHCEIKEGMAVADIGAGTGLFMELFARRVGPKGKVYAVDISKKMIDYMKERARKKGLEQVETVLCTRSSVELPANSVDVVFVCDTYHHFEYPKSTLATIHSALRPGGTMVIVDFDRIPGKTRKWVMDHVRAGREVFSSEILSAGFELVEEVQVRGLRENYFLRFRKK